MSKLIKLGCMLIAILTMAVTAWSYQGYDANGLTTGGDNGTVVHVTTLADSGAGSLRAAVDGLTGNPTKIVFDVGGTINLTQYIYVIHPYVSIAGETAPAPGITLDGSGNSSGTANLQINTHDVIVRHIRSRYNAGGREMIQVVGDYNIIIDHVSCGSGGDGALDINNGTYNITVSWCIFANTSEAHRSYGKYASLHHNFYYGNNRRQPKIVNYVGPYDFRNNVLENWTGTGTNVEAGHQVNIINNYYGPNTSNKAPGAEFHIDPNASVDIYIAGNVVPNDGSPDINLLGDRGTPNEQPNVTTYPADTNLQALVKGNAGAMPRDSYDQAIAGPGGLPIASWIRGSIHYHSTNSDGSSDVQTMVTSYRDTGGDDFSCITDHDYISNANAYSTGTFLGVNGIEASQGPHVVGFGVNGSGAVNWGTTLQAEINNVTANGGLPLVAHVRWSQENQGYDMPTLLNSMTGCNLISAYNWYCQDLWGNGNSESYWDTLLTAGKTIYGYAEDDAHGTGRTGYTFNMVNSAELTLDSIKTALQQGNFYFGHAATKWGAGITVSAYTVTGITAGNTISITTNGATTIQFIGQGGSVLQTTNASSAIYTITGAEPYVRVKATNAGGDITWMQPVFVGGAGGGNAAPVVDAGQNQTITLPSSANLNGTVTDDGLPNPPGAVTTTWTKTSGLGTVTFGNASAIDTTASFSTSGTYVLRLTANDSQLQAYDEVTITVNPAPSWSESADYYVNGLNGSDSNPGSSSQPWATLTKAVSSVTTAGKKCLVWGGQTYTGALTFNSSGTSASPITFKRDPASGTATINGNGGTSGTLYTTKATYIVIDGFTLTNNRYGVYIYGDAADGWTVKNSRVTGNSQHGVYIRAGDNHTLFNDAIYLNGSTNDGVYIYSSAVGQTITQCVVYKHKNGIHTNSSSTITTLRNCVVTNNTTTGILNDTGCTISPITYSDVWSNGANYSGCSAGTGCISANPLWVAPDSGDFHLGSGSPAHNTGSDGLDMGYRYSTSAL